jgi:hypothetical protein
MPARLSREEKIRRGTLRPGRDAPSAPRAAASRPPRPPKGLPAPEVEVWNQLASAVGPAGNGTYSASHLLAFRLAVRVVTIALTADESVPPSAVSRLLQAAGSALGRFGLDPMSVSRVSPAPKRPAPSDLDEFAVRREWREYPGKG